MKRIRINFKKWLGRVYTVVMWSVCLYAVWIVLRVLVNKPLKGARIFNVWDAAEHRPFEIRRLPGLEEFRRGEVLVFNFPYPERWDSIGFDVMLYYVKRCIGEPGDTVEIRDARYLVRGTDVPVGNTDAQERLSRLLSKKSGRKEMIRQHCYYTFPHDSTLGWNVCNFGPLYVPAREKVGAKGRWLLFGGQTDNGLPFPRELLFYGR